MRSKSILITAVFCALFITAFGLNTSWGDVIDQRWEIPHSSYDWGTYSIKNGYPLGQEFTAGRNNITGVELYMRLYNPPREIATVDVTIRDDTIQGSILASGTSAFDADGWSYFDFGGAVPLSVGHRYVIEASMLTGSEFWGWHSWNDADGIGVPGRLIREGQFVTPLVFEHMLFPNPPRFCFSASVR